MSLISKEQLSLTLQSIKALLSNKADKTQIVQSDWNQKDKTALDYVKNRPFYEEIKTKVFIDDFQITTNLKKLPSATYTCGEEYIIDFNGIQYTLSLTQQYDNQYGGLFTGFNLNVEGAWGKPTKADLSIPFLLSCKIDNTLSNGDNIKLTLEANIDSDISFPCVIKIYQDKTKVITLDPKFISSVDWNQSNPDESGYIKNRPCYKDYISNYVFVDVDSAPTSAQTSAVLNPTPAGSFVDGQRYIVTINGAKRIVTCSSQTLQLHISDMYKGSIYYSGGAIRGWSNWNEGASIKVVGPIQITKKLDKELYESVTSLDGLTGDLTLDSLSVARIKPTTILYPGHMTNHAKAVNFVDNISGYKLGEHFLFENNHAIRLSNPQNIEEEESGYYQQVYMNTNDTNCVTNISYVNSVKNTINTKINNLENKIVEKPSVSSVGQILCVKAINASQATEWETVDPWVIQSSTEGSTKKFKISVDDNGTLTATEIT